ncbi:uncharacterized protein K452DRAFT_283394, partial [Aplosporella prunicola CBS 121167]
MASATAATNMSSSSSNNAWPAATEDNPSLALYAPGDLRLEPRPVPQPTDAHSVLVRIAYIGCCGSDVHFWTHGGMRQYRVSPTRPVVMGHEAAGIVAAVGPAVTTLRPGDRVALEPGAPCRRCRPCKQGRYNLCKGMRFAAAPGGADRPDCDGALARFFCAPADFCYKLPANLGLDAAVLAEPLAVAVHACRLADVRGGQRVLVMGAGTVGLLCAAAARAQGASTIVVVDVLPHKLAAARALVPSVQTFVPDAAASPEDTAARLAAAFFAAPDDDDSAGPDVLLEATGAEACIRAGVHALRPGGVMVQVGLGQDDVAVPMLVLAEKEVTLRGSFRYGAGDFARALELLGSGSVDVAPLVSSVVPFERAVEAWEATRRGEGIKNLIQGVQ